MRVSKKALCATAMIATGVLLVWYASGGVATVGGVLIVYGLALMVDAFDGQEAGFTRRGPRR